MLPFRDCFDRTFLCEFRNVQNLVDEIEQTLAVTENVQGIPPYLRVAASVQDIHSRSLDH